MWGTVWQVIRLTRVRRQCDQRGTDYEPADDEERYACRHRGAAPGYARYASLKVASNPSVFCVGLVRHTVSQGRRHHVDRERAHLLARRRWPDRGRDAV